MAKNNESFNEKFLSSLFAMALKNQSLASIIVEYVSEEFLPNKEYPKILTEIRKNLRVHGKPPTIAKLFQKFDDDDDVFYLLEDIEGAETSMSTDEILEELQAFIMKARFMREYTEMGRLYNKGKKDEAINRLIGLSDEFNSFSIKKETFDPVIGGFADRNITAMAKRSLDNSEYSKKVVFGVDALDQLTKGVETKQLICFMAASGGGKTKAMRWVGATNARMGANVLHIQLEGSKEEALAGYGATLSGVHSSTIEHGLIDAEKLSDLEHAFGKIEGEIYVKTFQEFAKSPTTADVRRMTEDVEKAHNVKIHLIVVDYLELLNTADGRNWNPSEERHRRTTIADELKDIATEFDNVVLTSTQANDVPPSDLNNESFILSRHNVSEAKGIVKPLTMFITLNRTIDEIGVNRIRLFVDKSRFTRGGQTFEICTDYGADRFYDRKKTRELSQVNE